MFLTTDQLNKIHKVESALSDCKPFYVTVPITVPKEFEFDITPVLKYALALDIDKIQDEAEMDRVIDSCIEYAIIGYDDIFYYSFKDAEYKLVRDEVKKHIYTQLELDL